MNVQLVRRLEGAFRVHLVEEGSESALCGATSLSGWEIGPAEEGASCPLCQARMTTMREPVVIVPLPGGPGGGLATVPPGSDQPYVDPRRHG